MRAPLDFPKDSRTVLVGVMSITLGVISLVNTALGGPDLGIGTSPEFLILNGAGMITLRAAVEPREGPTRS